jgi:hypothetical protein
VSYISSDPWDRNARVDALNPGTEEPWSKAMTDSETFLIEAQFLVLILARLLKFTDVPHGGGDPTFLTAAQTEALAAEGVRLLGRYLPQEAARQVASAVEHLARPPHERREEALLRLGALGAVDPGVVDPDRPPGCCVFWPGRGLICVR